MRKREGNNKSHNGLFFSHEINKNTDDVSKLSELTILRVKMTRNIIRCGGKDLS
jgi:hypothetical protein